MSGYTHLFKDFVLIILVQHFWTVTYLCILTRILSFYRVLSEEGKICKCSKLVSSKSIISMQLFRLVAIETRKFQMMDHGKHGIHFRLCHYNQLMV